MTNFTFLTNLFGQRSEKTTRQSGHTLESIVSRFSLISLICACMLTLGIGNAWGYTYVFDVANWYTTSDKTVNLTTGTNPTNQFYYSDGTAWSGSGTNYYIHASKYLLLGKTSAALTMPTYSGEKITSVKLYNTSGCSTNVKVAIYSGTNVAASEQSWDSQNSDYTYSISSTYQETTLKVQVTNNYNAQISKIEITTVSTGGGGDTYAVTYNNGGHGTAPSNTTASSVTLAAITGVTGYTCTGWKADVATTVGGSPVAANTLIANGSTVTLSAATTFTAQWENAVYTITSTLTNCSSSSAIPATYTYTGNAAGLSYTISPTSGYELPTSITLQMGGAAMVLGTDYTWNSSTGALAISKVITGNITLTIVAMHPYTVTLATGTGTVSAGGWTGSGPYTQTAVSVTLPSASPSDACALLGWTFAGWKEGSAQTETTSKPSLRAAGSYSPNSDVSFYAVYKEGGVDKEDLLNRALTGITSSNYGEWSDKSGSSSSAVYAGNSAGGNDAIQLRSNNNNSGVITTTSGGKAAKVTVVWNSNTANGRVLNIYGKNTAYTAASNLYDGSTSGDLLGTIICGTSTELDITGDYEYIGFRSADGAMYLTSVTITWISGTRTWNSNPTCTGTADVTYDANGATSGTVPTDSNNPYDLGETVTVLGNTGTLARTGYTFDGWNTKADGSGTSYAVGSTFTIASDITLYAKWAEAEFAVTYNNGGHGTAPSSATVSKVTLTPITDAVGYVCIGWKANVVTSVGGNPVAANELIENGYTVKLLEATTFTAQWETAVYTITSTLNNCSSSPAIPSSYTYTGSAAGLSYTISASSGYELPATITLQMGGVDMASGTDYTWNSSTGTLAISKVITDDIVLTIEALTTHTVTLKDNESTLTQETIGANITLPTRTGCEGYTFAGWTKSWTSHQYTWTTVAPTIIPAGDYAPTTNEDLYPVYTKEEGESGNFTRSVNISSYATDHSWANGTKYESVTIDENVTATAAGGGNTGKYYTSGTNWRFYQGESATLTISTTAGTLSSVTITFSVDNTGTLTYGGSAITSGTPVAVSGTSAVFSVGNSGEATNGQVRITGISVTYSATLTTTSYISVSDCAIFAPGKTIFIQSGTPYSAWNDASCVKAWFNNSGSGGSAQSTYWLFDATDGDAGKKLFATIIPAAGDVNQVTLQRFAPNCTDFWNNNGTLIGSDATSNTFRTVCAGSPPDDLCLWWNATGVTLNLKRSLGGDSWTNSLGTFLDQGGGVWTTTYENYTPSATSADFKIETNYNGWIGNTGSNNNATLSDMIVGSTYNVTAALDVTDHSLVITKEFVKGTVNFDLQGYGSTIAPLTNVAADSKITAPTAPTASGYLFRGWYKEAECINEWDFENDVITETTTLYAKWTSDKFTVTWMANGSLFSTTNNVANESTTSAPSPAPTSAVNCDGTKIFMGWSAVEITGSTNTRPADLFTTTSPAITDNTTFYAVFAMANGTKTFEFEITPSYFNTTSYLANNTEKTSVATATDGSGTQMNVTWTSFDVMNGSGNAQFKKGSGYIYNNTDLGTVNSVIETSTTGTYTKWYGTSANPTSGAQGTGKGYFTIKETGNSAAGHVSKIVVNFTAPHYTGYSTTCVTDKCMTPIFDPGEGTYSLAQNVSILSTTGATIYYTTDGTDPASSGTRQTYSSAISVTTNTTIKAIAVKDGWEDSDVATATYNIRCVAPTFSPTPGTYLSFQQVTLSCAASNATIYFTLDGSTPTTESLEYAEAIDVNETMVIRAIAVKAGMAASEVAIGKYIIADCDWYESFASCSGGGGNDDIWTGLTGSGGVETDKPGWTITNGGYGGNQCIKAGTSSNNGYVYSPTISVTSGSEYKLTFEVAPWDDGKPMFELTNAVVSGGTYKWTAPANMTAGEWNKYEVFITTSADNISIKFFCTGKRFWLNDVCLKGLGDVKYHVTYDGNGETGGSVPTDATNYNRNATVTVLGNGSLVKAGYTFDGWNTKADGSGTNYTAGNTFSISQDVTLYAQWTIETYTIAWQVNGSPASGGATSATYGTQPASIPSAPTSGNCDGSKVFIGWSATALPDETDTRPKDLFTSKYAAPYITANTTFYAVFATPPAASTQFDLYSGALTEGEYLVTYNNKAMKAAVTTNRLNYEDVTPADDKISTNEPTLVWYLYQDGGYWRIYNTTAGYVAATKVKNQAVIILDGSDNKAKWTATGSTTYEFENKDRAESASNPDNKWLRENGTYGFACYATGTGNALTLYKRSAAYTKYSTSCAAADKPYLIADPTMLDFGNVAVNANVPAQTVTLSGANLGNTTVTVEAPNAGFTVSPATIAVNGELTATTITVTPVTTIADTYNGNLVITYTDPVTPANSITINIPLILKVSPLYTVTLHDLNTEDGNPQVSTLTQATPGSAVILPTTSPSTICMINGWVFAGWIAGSAQDETSDKPTLHLAEAYTPAENVDLYAVYMDRTACTTYTDNITRSTTTAEDNDTYTEWKDKQAANVGHSDAVYAGSTAGGNNAIQFRSTDESGLITTTPGATGGVVSRVSVTWNAATVTGRVLQVYGKNTPYGTTSELYDPENRGILLGTLTKGTNITTDVLTIDADFEYIGIRSKEDLAYATTISIEWSNSCTRKWNSNPACNPCTAKPTVNAAIVESFATTSATVNCSGITDITGEGGTGGCVITSYGYCWGISETPNLTDNFHEMGKTYTTLNNAFGEYTITGLTPGVKYCVRPYATNGLGTAYGAAECFTTTLVDHISFGVPNGVDAPQSVTLDVALPYADVPEDCGNCWVFVGWTLEDTWDAHVLPSPLYKPGYSATSQGLSGTHKLYAVYKRDFYRMLTYPSELLLDQDTTEFDDNYYVLTLYTGEETGEWAMDAALSGNYATTKNIDDILHLEYGNYSIFNPQPENIWHLEGLTKSGSGEGSTAATKIYNLVEGSSKKYIRLASSGAVITTNGSDGNLNFSITSNNEAGLAASFNIYRKGSGGGGYWGGGGSTYYYLSRMTFNNGKPGYTCSTSTPQYSAYIYKRKNLEYKTIPECPKYTVTWKLNGATVRTDYVSRCEGVPKPPTPPVVSPLDECGANGFLGWSTHKLGHLGSEYAPSDVFQYKEDAPELMGNVTFYAIYGYAAGYEYVGDKSVLTHGETYLLVNRKTQGAGKAIDASNLTQIGNSSGYTAPGGTVQVGAGAIIEGEYEDLEFYCDQRKAYSSNLRVASDASRTKYLHISDKGIGYKVNSARSHYTTKNLLYGWTDANSSSYRYAYWNNSAFTTSTYNKNVYAFRKLYKNFKTTCYEEWPATAVEWGQNKLIIDMDTTASVVATAAKYDVQIGSLHTSKMNVVQTKTSYNGYPSPRTFTIDGSSKFDFTTHAGDVAIVNWYDASNEKIAFSHIYIPSLVASNTTLTENKDELHVLPGAMLTVNKAHEVGQLEIYPGATVFITGATLKAEKFILRGGWNRINSKDSAMYDVGRVDIHPSGSLQKSHAFMDWYLDYDLYYPIAVPFLVATNDIVFKNEKFSAETTRSVIKMKYYDGKQRAETNQTMIGENWKDYSPLPTNLEPSKGYAFTAKRPSGRAFSIIRMPMSFTNAWTTNGEKGVVNGSQKNVVEITKYEYAGTIWKAMGWNFVANPYLALYNGNYLTGNLQIQYGGEVRYATIPKVDFQDYYQVDITKADLKPGSGFFVQAGGSAGQKQNIIFASDGRKHMPARTMRGTMDDQEVYIRLSHADTNDQMGIIVGEDYTEEYEINADLVKFMSTNDNSLKSYLRYPIPTGDSIDIMDMAYVALNPELAKEWIPVIVRVPAAGEYTYSLKESSKVSALEAVWLLDGLTGLKINLLTDEYTFHAAEPGTISGRFSINAIVRGEETPTGVGYLSDDDDKCVKFILNDHIYLRCNGMIYDMTGKTVELPIE